jgi:hypothetical protein
MTHLNSFGSRSTPRCCWSAVHDLRLDSLLAQLAGGNADRLPLSPQDPSKPAQKTKMASSSNLTTSARLAGWDVRGKSKGNRVPTARPPSGFHRPRQRPPICRHARRAGPIGGDARLINPLQPVDQSSTIRCRSTSMVGSALLINADFEFRRNQNATHFALGAEGCTIFASSCPTPASS